MKNINMASATKIKAQNFIMRRFGTTSKRARNIVQLWNETLYVLIVAVYVAFSYAVTEAITPADCLQIGGIALIMLLHRVLLRDKI